MIPEVSDSFDRGVHSTTFRNPVSISQNTIHVGNLSIKFQRTLRIPNNNNNNSNNSNFNNNNNNYSNNLPHLGFFPIYNVNDYSNKVPESWRRTGGVFIPMLQREAMRIDFSSNHASNEHAVKIGVGGTVNAVDGNPWHPRIEADSRDFLVVPKQPCLDGIHSPRGNVHPFIAMPLSNIIEEEEEEATYHGNDRDEFGGIQIMVFSPKPQYRLRQQHNLVRPTSASRSRERRRSLPDQRDMILPSPSSATETSLSDALAPSSHIPKNNSVSRVSSRPTISSLSSSSSSSKNKEKEEIEKEENEENKNKNTTSTTTTKMTMTTMGSELDPLPSKRSRSTVRELEVRNDNNNNNNNNNNDGYNSMDAEYWDHNHCGRVLVHRVNSAMFEEITGRPVPPTRVTRETYEQFDYPWLSIYEEGEGEGEEGPESSKMRDDTGEVSNGDDPRESVSSSTAIIEE